MKRTITKAICILSFFVMLSFGAVNVSASTGACSIPSCRPRIQYAVSATAPSVTAPTAQPEDSFSLASFLMELWMGFLYL